MEQSLSIRDWRRYASIFLSAPSDFSRGQILVAIIFVNFVIVQHKLLCVVVRFDSAVRRWCLPRRDLVLEAVRIEAF
jgi:hypothetical protein